MRVVKGWTNSEQIVKVASDGKPVGEQWREGKLAQLELGEALDEARDVDLLARERVVQRRGLRGRGEK